MLGEIVAQSEADAQSAANLDLERISSVLGEAGTAMTKADGSLNASDLSGRVSQGALATRTAQYALASATGQTPQTLDFTPTSLAITNSESWPRAIFNISGSSSTALPVLQVYVQDSARSDYQLTNYARLLGGTQLTLPPVGTGSAYVTGTSDGFTVSPDTALAQYITMLNSGSQDTTQFVADEFTKLYLSNVADINSSVSAAGTVTAAATASDYPISGLVLQDGSALVAANFKYTLTYQRTVAGATMSLAGNTAALSSSARAWRDQRQWTTWRPSSCASVAERRRNHPVVGGERTIVSVSLDSSSSPG
ncbi:hypothetical protein SAMN04489715_0582 [Schaalia meyeri]|uniref:hypothetical protein n=1 Tax=Schaalia meyeri TaxID=52773 RepID=UPI000892A962|nr:hypothetical protein [Schaalia meyeri]SDR65381.1 hypothetical protein SAMN04489715_0582 [Schaalia meyeri]